MIQRGSEIDDILTDSNELQLDWKNSGRLDSLLDWIISGITGQETSVARVPGKTQIFEKSINSAANVGDVTVATVTFEQCMLKSLIIHADAAQTADMTTCEVTCGAAKVVSLIGVGDATQANLDAEDKQVKWTGAVWLEASKTIIISLVGGGATNVNLTIIVEYESCANGGYLQ